MHHQDHNVSTPLRHFSAGLRLLTCFLAFWLWMMPQVLNASGTRVICDEFGVPMPSPASEEEEVKHSKLPPLVYVSNGAPRQQLPGRSLREAQHPTLGTLKEVPYPPPK
jgi:hypothetical protein